MEDLAEDAALGLLIRQTGAAVGVLGASLLLVEAGEGGHEAGALRGLC